MRLHENRFLRRIALPLLARVGDFDISIRHHYTRDILHLNIFRHKGYWYLGKNRERHIMAAFAQLIKKDDIVIDAGGHIGYISLYFSRLVGDSGQVFVFEPGINNLPYIERNLDGVENISLIKMALSDRSGRSSFYIENTTGQNNSLINTFWVLQSNTRNSFIKSEYSEVSIETTTLDEFVTRNKVEPQLVKIDVEGAEFGVLRGAQQTIRRYKPALMLEVNMNHADVYRWLLQNDYIICDCTLKPLQRYQESGMPNIFCLHRDGHAEFLERTKEGIENSSQRLPSPLVFGHEHSAMFAP